MRYYQYQPIFWFLRDESDAERLARLTFHIEQGDYFPFLASVISFLEETARDCPKDPENKTKAEYAASIRKDLIHLHEHYHLTPNDVPRMYSTRKMVRF